MSMIQATLLVDCSKQTGRPNTPTNEVQESLLEVCEAVAKSASRRIGCLYHNHKHTPTNEVQETPLEACEAVAKSASRRIGRLYHNHTPPTLPGSLMGRARARDPCADLHLGLVVKRCIASI